MHFKNTVFKSIIILFLIFLIAGNSYAQWGLTNAEIDSFAQGQFLNILNPNNNTPENVFAGLLNGSVDGNSTQFYSVIVKSNLNFPDTSYTDTTNIGSNPCSSVLFILNNYFPYKTNYSGILSNINDEAAAVQLAIWYFSDTANVNTVENILIKERALSIISVAISNSVNNFLPVTFEIVSDISPESFLVKTTDELGNGISVDNIDLLLTQSYGYLSTNNVNTTDGYSPSVEVIGSGVGLIFATGNCIFPQGSVFKNSIGLNRRSLFLAKPVTGRMNISYDWGALPVELLSFTFSVSNRDVTLNWSTATEINNSRFEIERLASQSVSGVKAVWIKTGSLNGVGSSNIIKNYTFTDKNLSTGKYNYRLKQIDFNGNFEYFNLSNEVEVGTPSGFELSQNYPNPFNPSTKINFSMSKEGNVSVKVFDNTGKQVATLLNDFRNVGFYTIDFNASGLTSGIYYYKMETNGLTKVMKMILIK